MKEFMVVKFTGVGNAAKAGDVTVWADYTADGMVYDSPAYEIVARSKTFTTAQAIARRERHHAKYSGKTEFVKQLAEQQGWDIYQLKM